MTETAKTKKTPSITNWTCTTFQDEELHVLFPEQRVGSHDGYSLRQIVFIRYGASLRTLQHSEWNCVGASRPQHMHMYEALFVAEL